MPPPPVSALPEDVDNSQTNGSTVHTAVIDATNEKENVKVVNSPLLTSHRISDSSLDNVNLNEDGEDADTNPIPPPPKGSPSQID